MSMTEDLRAAVGDGRGTGATDRLCAACVDVLGMDAAAVSLVFDGVNSATVGSSSAVAAVYDELQFTLGEGPCLESVSDRTMVLVDDLADPTETRWPAYRTAMLEYEVHGVYAMPITVAGEYVAALDLFRHRPGPLRPGQLAGALTAAELAGLPLLDLLERRAGAGGETDWTQLQSLTRVEISQATGMLVAQLDVDPVEALVRLRAHAYATSRSPISVARDILARRLRLDEA